MERDTLFARPAGAPADFAFDARTAAVFDDMLARSVPLYDEVQFMLAELAARFTADGGRVYDLGCSAGITLLRIAERLEGRAVRLVGVDSSAPMLARAQARFAQAGRPQAAAFVQHDLDDAPAFEPADVHVLCLTLQFVRPPRRAALLARVRDSLKPGGALLLVEKVLTDDPCFSRAFIDLYHAFKRRNGYSADEIARKREALENVLVPYRPGENEALLHQAGFAHVEAFFRWYNFAGFVATTAHDPPAPGA